MKELPPWVVVVVDEGEGIGYGEYLNAVAAVCGNCPAAAAAAAVAAAAAAAYAAAAETGS